MECNCCFTDYLAKCETEIKVNVILNAETAYRWVITDKFGNKYESEVTTDAAGAFTIPVEDLPAGLLTEYSGDFTLQVFPGAGSCGPVRFKIAGEYDCISFNVKGGTFEKNNIGCEVACTSAGSSNVLIPFTDAATLDIDYSNYQNAIGNNPTIQVYHLTAPNTYQLVSVAINQIRANDILTDIEIDNGGVATGYVLIS